MKQFSTILTILFITFFISTNVWGQLFDENFNYVTGTYLTVNGWTAHSGSGSQPLQVTSPGLTYTGYPNSNIGEATTVIGGSGSREDVHHTFTSQNSGSVYAFFILNVHADTGTADYFFHLGPDPISTTFRGRVFLKDSAGNFAFGLSKGSTSNVTYTGFNYSRNTTYLLGLRYTFNTGSTTDDAVSLWINPPLDGTQPAPNLTQTDAAITDASNIGAVALRQGANYYDVTVDGIRIQTTWLLPNFSVTPTSLDYSNLLVGSVHTDSVTVTNTGSVPLNITSVASDHPEFTVLPTSGSIPASSSANFYVTFSPISAGLKTGNIVFTHDAQSSPDTITVSGTGIDYMTIGAARLRPNGDTVTIQGIITRALGAFTRIQDATGGLSVRQASGPFYDSLAGGGIRPGDLVKLRGILSEYASLKQFNQADIHSFERISRGNPLPIPQLVTLSEIALNGEQYESELITIANMSINPAGDVNFAAAKTYSISDTSDLTNAVALRIPNATDSDVDGTSIPAGPFTFTGVLGQFSFSDPAIGYQILPVLVTDIDFQVDVRESDPLPTVFALKGNYPNPFNPSTTIKYQLPVKGHVTINVFDVLGREVATLVNGVEGPGYESVNFTARGLASGIYYYRLSAGNFVQTMKLVLMK